MGGCAHSRAESCHTHHPDDRHARHASSVARCLCAPRWAAPGTQAARHRASGLPGVRWCGWAGAPDARRHCAAGRSAQPWTRAPCGGATPECGCAWGRSCAACPGGAAVRPRAGAGLGAGSARSAAAVANIAAAIATTIATATGTVTAIGPLHLSPSPGPSPSPSPSTRVRAALAPSSSAPRVAWPGSRVFSCTRPYVSQRCPLLLGRELDLGLGLSLYLSLYLSPRLCAS